MKTINSKKLDRTSEDIQLFKNESTEKSEGFFVGTVQLYDKEIYVDTRDGTGYKEVIENLSPLINKFALKYHFNGNSFEDTRHDVIVHILEGIPRYDPSKNAKLSTFMEMRINRRLINSIRDKSRVSKNATILNINSYSVTCDCGNSFIAKLDKNYCGTCYDCGKEITKHTKKVLVGTPEINESMVTPDVNEKSIEHEDTDLWGEKIRPIDEEVIFMRDMACWLREEDPRVVKALELIYFGDYSKAAAAKEVGLTSAGLGLKIKDLRKKRIVQEIFGR